jgi:hypothetical protein
MRSLRSLFVVLLLGALPGGCRLAQSAVEAPAKLANAALGGDEDDRQRYDPWAMSQWMMGFADTASAEIEASTQEFAETAGTDEARIKALEWRIEYTTIAIQLATAPQPYDGFLRVLLALTVLRANDQAIWQAEWGEAAQPIGDAVGRLEDLAWGKAEKVFEKERLAKIRRVIDEWLAANPDARASALPNLHEVFKPTAGEGEEEQTGFVGELTDLFTLDPLAGIEPATREVELTRQFAERTFFHLQRMPRLLEAQAELLALRATTRPESRGFLEGFERVSLAAESIAGTAGTLPGEISAELTRQREGLVRDLETAKDPALELLESARTTLEATRETSLALTEALRAFDTMMARFDRPDEPEPVEEEPSGRPFDITEYGDTAEKIGVAAHELTAAIATLDGTIPKLESTLDSAALRAQATVDRAYRRALQLLIVALLGSLAVWLAAGWVRDRRRTPAR